MPVSWEEHAGEDPRTGEQDPEQQFKLYRLCECFQCGGSGKSKRKSSSGRVGEGKCAECRGEGKIRELVATCSEDSLGKTILRLGREGTWIDCPFGLLDTMGKVNEKWLVKPWLPSARNISDAGRQLASARQGTK